jgi:hypothetical protein
MVTAPFDRTTSPSRARTSARLSGSSGGRTGRTTTGSGCGRWSSEQHEVTARARRSASERSSAADHERRSSRPEGRVLTLSRQLAAQGSLGRVPEGEVCGVAPLGFVDPSTPRMPPEEDEPASGEQDEQPDREPSDEHRVHSITAPSRCGSGRHRALGS